MAATVHARTVIVEDQAALMLYNDAAGYWELPGAPVRDGETPRAAAGRGASAALDCTVQVRSPCHRLDLERTHDGTDYRVRGFAAAITDGTPAAAGDGYSAVAWQDADSLAGLDLAPSAAMKRPDLRLLLLRSAG